MAGSGGRGSLRARRRLGTASPPPAPFPPGWGSGDAQGAAVPGPAPPALPCSSKGGESRASSPGGALRGEGMNPPPSRGTDPGLSSLGSLGVPALGPPCTPLPTDTCQDSPAPGEPTGRCGFQRSWEGQWHNPPFPPQPREREPLTGDPAVAATPAPASPKALVTPFRDAFPNKRHICLQDGSGPKMPPNPRLHPPPSQRPGTALGRRVAKEHHGSVELQENF